MHIHYNRIIADFGSAVNRGRFAAVFKPQNQLGAELWQICHTPTVQVDSLGIWLYTVHIVNDADQWSRPNEEICCNC